MGDSNLVTKIEVKLVRYTALKMLLNIVRNH